MRGVEKFIPLLSSEPDNSVGFGRLEQFFYKERVVKSPLTVLVVEDNSGHMEDCRTMLKEVCPKLSIEVMVVEATNLKEAFELLPQADVVMTDVFFPTRTGMSADEPNGMTVVEECLYHSKPVVWVTSTYHHGHKTESVSGWGRSRGLEMFDCNPSHPDGEAPHKPWKKAFVGLLFLTLAFEVGCCKVEDKKLVGLADSYPGNWANEVASGYLKEGRSWVLEEELYKDSILPLFLALNIPR